MANTTDFTALNTYIAFRIMTALEIAEDPRGALLTGFAPSDCAVIGELRTLGVVAVSRDEMDSRYRARLTASGSDMLRRASLAARDTLGSLLFDAIARTDLPTVPQGPERRRDLPTTKDGDAMADWLGGFRS